MPHVFPSVKTNIEWIKSLAEPPIIGEAFLFTLIFVPAVLLSFLAQTIIPYLDNDIGFTKAMLLLLPIWNIFLRYMKIRLYMFLLPTWILLPILTTIKGIVMFFGNN